MKRLIVSVSAAAIALLLAATAQVAPVAAQAGSTGTIEGRVRLAAPARANAVIRMGLDPLCGRLQGADKPRQEITLRSADGGLANAFVDLEGTFPATPLPSTPAVINQRKCLYAPRVIGARVGQVLRLINSDTLVHNVHSLSTKGNDFNETQPHSDMVFNYTLKAEELLRLKCDVHSWMTAYVGVVNHPYFAVSDEMGTFTIKNVPAGHQTVRAWHERYGRITMTADVKAGATTMVTLEYSGNEKPSTADVHDLLVPASGMMAQLMLTGPQ
jgi:plastocyanin